MGSIEALLRERALELGFSQVGIAPAERPETSDRYLDWVASGRAGELHYLTRAPERRADPRVFWPPARSLVIVAAVHPAPRLDHPRPLRGRIARFACLDDYHDQMQGALSQLASVLQAERPGAQWRTAVDTSAVLERAHAARAGLGWIGKNGMLLSQSLGSSMLLGVLFTSLEMQYDSPLPQRCGSCKCCLEACPTGALEAPYLLDARRCLSNITIELRGTVPSIWRNKMAPWLFGCDRCQQVCPWVRKNRRLSPSKVLGNERFDSDISLEELVDLSEEAFSAHYAATPVSRAKRTGLVRNAVVLLGSSEDRDAAVEFLAKAACDSSPLVRAHAADSLGRQGGARARRCLERWLQMEKEPEVYGEIEQALEHMT